MHLSPVVQVANRLIQF